MISSSYSRGLALQKLGRHEEAALAIQDAINTAPGFAPALFHLGISLFELGLYTDAVAAYEAAVDVEPAMFEARNNLGMALQKLGKYQSALESYERALEINPGFAPLYNSRGNCLVLLDRASDALADFERAITINPDYADAINNRAILLHRSNRLDEAAVGYDRAIALAAAHGVDFAAARFNRSLLRLLRGDFATGWAEYDYRLHLDGYHGAARHVQQWDGQPVDGVLFVRAEQGYGDTFQFVRYLSLAREHCTRLVFECQYGLAGLLEASGLCDEIVERPESGAHLPAPDGAAIIYVQSLPRVFQTTESTISNRVPYLRAPEYRRVKWAEVIESMEPRERGRRRVGIVWRGNQTEPVSRLRSCELSDFAVLAAPDIAFFSLQVGVGLSRSTAPRFQEAQMVTRLGDDFADFADTAAAIEQMDLVITIDTSVAHLAGALGKPVWTLLPWCPDWRWMEYRIDSPWYPTMRLFRQPGLGQWEPVFENVKNALTAEFP